MALFAAKVVPVCSGSRTLKDAVNEALRDWAASWEDTHYLLGSGSGAEPLPRHGAGVPVGGREELVEQMREQMGEEVVALVACVRGGSNPIGFFARFIEADRPKPWARLPGRGSGTP